MPARSMPVKFTTQTTFTFIEQLCMAAAVPDSDFLILQLDN